MGDNPNMVDQIFSIGVLAFILALVILMKDIIDGGTFSPSERRSALFGFGLAGLLVLSALTMSMLVSDTVSYQYTDEDHFSNTKYYVAGGTLTTISHAENEGQLVVSPLSGMNELQITFNITTLDRDFWEASRGINLNISDDGIDQVVLTYKSGGTTYTLLDSNSASHTDKFTITDLGSTSSVKINYTDITALQWVSQHSWVSGDEMKIIIRTTSDYNSAISQVFDFEFIQENQAELSNFLIWAVMSFALYIPLMVYLDAFNNIRRFVNEPFGRRRRRMTKMSRR